jgi:hypothetical protein
MNGSQFWELYQSYGDVYRQEVLNEEVEVEEGYVDAYKAPGNYRRPNGSSMLGHPANLSPAMRAMQKSDDLQNSEPGSKRQKTQTRSSNQLNRLYGSARRAGNVNASYEYDLYDVVLEHILDEGFADTLEDAQVLMANMSEQWIDSIVEATEDSEVAGELARLRGQMRTAMQKGDDSAIQSISRRLAEIQPAARAKIGAEMRGRNKRKSSTVQEDASTINYYQRLLSAAQREGDKSKVAKYGRMIDKIQQSVSQRG